MLKKITSELRRMLNDERGAEGLEKILLIGALILPLLGILIFFKDNITEWVSGLWTEVKDDNQGYQQGGDPFQ